MNTVNTNSLYEAMLADIDVDSRVQAALDALDAADLDMVAITGALSVSDQDVLAARAGVVGPLAGAAAARFATAVHAVGGYASAHTAGAPSADVAVLAAAAADSLEAALAAWLEEYEAVADLLTPQAR